MLLGYIIVMFQSGQISFDNLICVIRPALPSRTANFLSFARFSCNRFAACAVLPSTWKPVKSYNFQVHLLFGQYLQIFVPRPGGLTGVVVANDQPRLSDVELQSAHFTWLARVTGLTWWSAGPDSDVVVPNDQPRAQAAECILNLTSVSESAHLQYLLHHFFSQATGWSGLCCSVFFRPPAARTGS